MTAMPSIYFEHRVLHLHCSLARAEEVSLTLFVAQRTNELKSLDRPRPVCKTGSRSHSFSSKSERGREQPTTTTATHSRCPQFSFSAVSLALFTRSVSSPYGAQSTHVSHPFGRILVREPNSPRRDILVVWTRSPVVIPSLLRILRPSHAPAISSAQEPSASRSRAEPQTRPSPHYVPLSNKRTDSLAASRPVLNCSS